MKKITSLALAILLMLTAAGCGTSNAPAQSSSAAGSTSAVTASEAPAPEDAQPEGYPAKTIEFIVPAAAGASLDLYTRAINEALDLGTPLQITNMAGGSQTIGLMELGTRKADGYSMGITAFAGMVIQPQLVDVTYNIDSFRPVAMSSGPNSYTVCVKSGAVTDYDSFENKISQGETVYWTSPNAGSPAHLAGLYYLKEKGIEHCEYVSYNGAAEALTALLSGDVSFLITDDSVVAAREADGQVTGIITLSDARSAILPEVICAEEKGVTGMGVFDAFSWIIMPAGTPDDIYNWVKGRIDSAVTSPSYQEFLKNSNFVEMKGYTEQELKDMISESYQAISEVVDMLK